MEDETGKSGELQRVARAPKGVRAVGPGARALRGIVIANGRSSLAGQRPTTVVAFIWGGKVKPVPRLPYGRLPGAA